MSSMAEKAAVLRELADDPTVLEAGRKAVEDALVEWRDEMRFMICGNGFAIRNRDGSPSEIIRFRTDFGLSIALRAMADAAVQS